MPSRTLAIGDGFDHTGYFAAAVKRYAQHRRSKQTGLTIDCAVVERVAAYVIHDQRAVVACHPTSNAFFKPDRDVPDSEPRPTTCLKDQFLAAFVEQEQDDCL